MRHSPLKLQSASRNNSSLKTKHCNLMKSHTNETGEWGSHRWADRRLPKSKSTSTCLWNVETEEMIRAGRRATGAVRVHLLLQPRSETFIAGLREPDRI
jgi:hypothetical protein